MQFKRNLSICTKWVRKLKVHFINHSAIAVSLFLLQLSSVNNPAFYFNMGKKLCIHTSFKNFPDKALLFRFRTEEYLFNIPTFRGGSKIASTKTNKSRWRMRCGVEIMAAVLFACFASDSLPQSILLYVGMLVLCQYVSCSYVYWSLRKKERRLQLLG